VWEQTHAFSYTKSVFDITGHLVKRKYIVLEHSTGLTEHKKTIKT